MNRLYVFRRVIDHVGLESDGAFGVTIRELEVMKCFELRRGFDLLLFPPGQRLERFVAQLGVVSLPVGQFFRRRAGLLEGVVHALDWLGIRKGHPAKEQGGRQQPQKSTDMSAG